MRAPFRTVLVAVAALSCLTAVVVLAPSPAAGKSSGANPGFAGNMMDPSGPRTCTVCHSTYALNQGTGSLAVDVAGTVAPGETVPITVTLDNQTPPAAEGSARQGFEATVRDPETGELWGRLLLADGTNTKYAGDGAFADTSYVTHTLAGTAQSAWTFEWEPGPDRAGAARVYVAANAANGNGTSSGDYIYATTVDVVVGGVASAPAPEAAFSVGAPRPHPVPRGRAARLELSLERPGAVSAVLVDGLGRALRTLLSADRAAGTSSLDVPTAGLAPGTYFVVVDGPGGRRTRPVVVR